MSEAVHSRRLAKESVVQVLLDTLRTLTGNDVELNADSNIVELEREYQIFESLGFVEWQMLIEEQLDLGLSTAEIEEFFFPGGWIVLGSQDQWNREVVPTLTVSALAEFILDRVTRIKFEPVSILGSPPCPAAGYFLGMSELVKTIRPDTERFGPSTPIRQVLSNSDLRNFWHRLRRSRRPLPSLRFNLQRIADALLVVSCLLLIVGVLVDWAFLAMIWLLCIKGISFGWWLRKRANPLPTGIVTFGDLARHLTRNNLQTS